MDFSNYLRATYYMDADNELIKAYAEAHTKGKATAREKAVALFYAVRDGIRYNPYRVILRPEALRASFQLGKDNGYCIEKSNLFATAARAVGIPSRLGFANVRNHLATSRLEEILGTDLLVFHGYAEVYLEGQWRKATPVFDAALCQKLGVEPLEFDGETDCVFQQSDKAGRAFMEYVDDHGLFDDVPFEAFVENLRLHYGHLFDRPRREGHMIFEF